ncbi:uncharacterized protein LOC107610655 [Arachis ipaensis]|uniref:uncharacterized protein LOC107610655 n=1 Tax=Arachis ipaensis TaxID=130454 RepID=UPI0007AFAA34|nr:uncharacterized protein LOC107610655 [Arachis ipaensis]
MEKKEAHRYVVLNCPYVKPFIDDFKDFVRRRSKGRRPSNVEIEKRVNKDFVTWFPTQLMNPDIMNTVHEDLRYLARGPSQYAKRFSTFSINGFSFRTTNRDNGLRTQNSGVFLMSSTPCVASASDTNVRNVDLSYYGKLEDITTMADFGGDREEDDPYIEASQARMVYFVNDEVNKDWSVVVHLKPRDSYDMGEMKMMKHVRMSLG